MIILKLDIELQTKNQLHQCVTIYIIHSFYPPISRIIKKSFKNYRTYAKERAVGAIHELPLRQNETFRAFLRKS